MESYISVENARAIIRDYLPCQEDEDAIIAELGAASASDVAPVIHARWEKARDTIKCSACGFCMFPLDAYRKGDWPHLSVGNWKNRYVPRFCPHCGAKMDGQAQ